MTGGLTAGRQTTKGASKRPCGPKSRGEQKASGALARCRSTPWRGEGRSSVVEWIGRRSGSFSDGDSRRLATLGGYVRRSKSHPQWGQASVTNGISASGRTGVRGIEGSVNPSRGPARPNRVHPTTVSSTRFDSSIADFDSRHRALSLRRRELGHGAIRGPARRAPRGVPRLKWMWRFLRPKPRLEESPYPLTRVARVEVRHASPLRRRSYPGRMR
jgi:hypothetical protein